MICSGGGYRLTFCSNDLFCCRAYFACRPFAGIHLSKLVYYLRRDWRNSQYFCCLFKELGEVIVWIALVLYFALLPIILKRVVHQKLTERAAVPLITILTAPGSLCLAGYLSVFEQGSAWFVAFMLLLSQTIYFCVVAYMKNMLAVGFYPSYAAFTFPLVISATAMFKSALFLRITH